MKTTRLPALFALVALLAAPLAAYEGWMTDLAAAQARAARENKSVLIDFTGSAWCPPCIALHGEVLTSPEFAAFARDYILVKLDYPRSSERTPEKIAADPALAKLMALKDQFKVTGFPTVVVLDAQGSEKARRVGYGKGTGAGAYLAKLSAELK